MNDSSASDRRDFLSRMTRWFMTGGLAAGYGACGAMGARYLFPSERANRAWLFVTRVDEMRPGDSLEYQAPSGQKVAIARQGKSGDVEDFVALSSTCPHLGCQVHWQAANERFFCPCHNGVFDPSGLPVEGPPAEANQALPRFPLTIRDGSLFIEVPTDSLGEAELAALDPELAPPGPGHDPCLFERGPAPPENNEELA